MAAGIHRRTGRRVQWGTRYGQALSCACRLLDYWVGENRGVNWLRATVVGRVLRMLGHKDRSGYEKAKERGIGSERVVAGPRRTFHPISTVWCCAAVVARRCRSGRSRHSGRNALDTGDDLSQSAASVLTRQPKIDE